MTLQQFCPKCGAYWDCECQPTVLREGVDLQRYFRVLHDQDGFDPSEWFLCTVCGPVREPHSCPYWAPLKL